MNLLHVLATRGASLAAARPSGLVRPARRLNHTATGLIALPGRATIRGLVLGRKTLSVLVPAAGNNGLGPCAACGEPVTESDPFIRYRGEYYHAHGCAETNPPALTRRQHRVSLRAPDRTSRL
jgi:hypothetical protein